MSYLLGIDVSRHQGDIDWVRLKRESAVAVVLVRATLGHTGVDDRYRENWRESGWAGFQRRGLYHYYITESPPVLQVEHIFRATGKDFGTEPFVLDCERRADERLRPFDRVSYTRNVRSFLNYWIDHTNHPIHLYSSKVEWSAITTEPLWAADFGWHVAHYNPLLAEPWLPRFARTWDTWQYSSTGRLPGIAGNVDLNRVKGDLNTPSWKPVIAAVRRELRSAENLLRH